MIGVIHYAYGVQKSIDDVATYFSHILIWQNGSRDAMLEKLRHHLKSLVSSDFIASSTQRKKGVNIFPHDVYTFVIYRRIICPSANSFAILTAL